MPDFLDTLARDAKQTVTEGYYKVSDQHKFSPVSLRKAITENRRNAVITEVKAASPSRGTIKTNFDPERVAVAMEKGGATGISVLTEPKHFGGSLSYLTKIRKATKLPILMKDIIISPIQLEAASRIGADAVLLIEALFERECCELSLDEMISEAHARNLEVLLETHNEDEFQSAIETDADLVGINNRDLRTLEVDIRVTERILKKYDNHEKVVVSESGVMTLSDLLFLRGCGAQAFLIGSAIMMAGNIEEKVKEFVTAH
ncbi:MAG TPA: indole-3-glycerol-phosphate synthase [Candidatus Bathyarchaeota archaeon]|nr:indole-3-glycerol-phosphate synthase [Candidatus Bathyarchaeota archaeon]